MNTPQIVDESEPISKKERQLIKLRRDLINVRRKWEKVVAKACFNRYDIGNSARELPSKRARSRYIYFVWMPETPKGGNWVFEMRKEFERLEKRVVVMGFKDQRPQNGLWCPRLIFDPIEMDVTTYYSRKADPITKRAAQAFSDKAAGLDKAPGTVLAPSHYFLVRPASKDHRIRVTTADDDNRISELDFKAPEWSACFLHEGAIPPTVKHHRVKPNKTRQAPGSIGKRGVEVVSEIEGTFLVSVQGEETAFVDTLNL